jgi:hypothetical protein
MAKTVLLLGIDGLACAPARACAETAEEALHLDLPMLGEVLGQMCAGKDARPDGASRYKLYHEGQPTGTIEIFEIPRSERAE